MSRPRTEYLAAHSSDRLTVGDVQSQKEDEEEDEGDRNEDDQDEDTDDGYSE